jgi:hypothetical protein
MPILFNILLKTGGEMAYPQRLFRVTLLLILWLAGMLLWSPPLRAQNHAGLPPDLQALITESLQANAEVKQMRFLHSASKETIKPAGALEDPEIGFSL